MENQQVTFAEKIDSLFIDEINKLKDDLYKQIELHSSEEDKLHKELDELNEQIKKDNDEETKLKIKERINELNNNIIEYNENIKKISKLILEDIIKIKENKEVKLEI